MSHPSLPKPDTGKRGVRPIGRVNPLPPRPTPPRAKRETLLDRGFEPIGGMPVEVPSPLPPSTPDCVVKSPNPYPGRADGATDLPPPSVVRRLLRRLVCGER